MCSFSRIFYYCVYSILSSLKSPWYWIVLLIVVFQYKRLEKIGKVMLGSVKEPLYVKVITSGVVGLLGGVVGSVILLYLETTVSAKDFYILLPLALLLSIIHPRFICFSYAGGIVALSSLIFGYPEINVASIMTIIAVLHLVESLLIVLDGSKGKIPIFMEREGQVVGGFAMNRFWPVPFIVLFNGRYEIYPVTVMAILGYGDFAITQYPYQKTRHTASALLSYSIILLTFSQLSYTYPLFNYISAIFAPLCHEIIIFMGRRKEKRQKTLFQSSSQGVKILDTIPKGVGEKIGLNTGDIILSVNGSRVATKEDIENVLKCKPSFIWIDVFKNKKGVVTEEYKDYVNGIRSLDILVVPNEYEYTFIVEESEAPLIRWIKKLKNK